MKRAARWGLYFVLAAAVLALAALFWLDSLTRAAIERGGSHALGVEMRLESVDIGLLAGDFALHDLEVANPPGFTRPNFFSVHSARLELPLSRLFEPRVAIPALELEGITIDLESGSEGTNFGQILDHLTRFESGEGAAETPPSGKAKTYHLQRLEVRDLRASFQLVPAGGDLMQLEVTVPSIEVDDLASDMTLPQICGLVVRVVLRAAMEAGQGLVPQELLTDLRSRIDGLEALAHERLATELESLEEKVGEHAQRLGPEAERALQKATDELGGRLDGLLKKKN